MSKKAPPSYNYGMSSHYKCRIPEKTLNSISFSLSKLLAATLLKALVSLKMFCFKISNLRKKLSVIRLF